jgi:hypothetical protein
MAVFNEIEVTATSSIHVVVNPGQQVRAVQSEDGTVYLPAMKLPIASSSKQSSFSTKEAQIPSPAPAPTQGESPEVKKSVTKLAEPYVAPKKEVSPAPAAAPTAKGKKTKAAPAIVAVSPDKFDEGDFMAEIDEIIVSGTEETVNNFVQKYLPNFLPEVVEMGIVAIATEVVKMLDEEGNSADTIADYLLGEPEGDDAPDSEDEEFEWQEIAVNEIQCGEGDAGDLIRAVKSGDIIAEGNAVKISRGVIKLSNGEAIDTKDKTVTIMVAFEKE